MKLSRNLALSCEILAAHKLRTLLSVTGVVVGVGLADGEVVLELDTGKRVNMADVSHVGLPATAAVADPISD